MKTITLSGVAALLLSLSPAGLGAQFLYWSAVNGDLQYAIRRSALDGSDVKDVVTGIKDGVDGVAIDPGAGRLYWIERAMPGSRIMRSNLDGSGPEPVHSSEDMLSRIALDTEHERIYFTASSLTLNRYGVWRFPFAGGDPEQVVPAEVYDLAVDGAGGKIYYVREGASGTYGTDIWRAELDGTGPEPIIHHPFEHHTTGIALDVPGGKIYWATTDYHSGGIETVQRANLDGSELEPVTTANPGLDDWPVFVGLDLPNRMLYWVNGEDGEFYRVSFDGGEAEPLFEDAGPYGPFGLAVDHQEETPRRFRRGDVNGDSVMDLSDVITVLNFMFLGGAPLACDDAADVDDSGVLDITDAVDGIGYLYLGSYIIPAPGPVACGPDPTPTDALDCQVNLCNA